MRPDLRDIAREIRRRVLRMHRVGPNVGSAMSCADILAALYFEVMDVPAPQAPGRDRFVLSKGHAASALYATLALRGFIDEALLEGYLRDGSPLAGHPARGAIPGVEVSTGSLGHGLPIGVGLAHAAKLDGADWRTFVLMGDGECQEGSVWEGAMMAARLGLDNLVAIVDANGLQGYARTDEILPRAALRGILEAFGWAAVDADGHDPEGLARALAGPPLAAGRPTAIVAHTVKGKGVAEMEDALGWHYYSVPAAKLPAFLSELDEPEERR